MYSDFVTTVSPTYAGEIKTPYYGEGLDGVLTDIDAKLLGILNGIDTDEYNPATDTMIDFCYDKRNFVSQEKN